MARPNTSTDLHTELARLAEAQLTTAERARAWCAIHGVPRHELDRLEGIAEAMVRLCLELGVEATDQPRLKAALRARGSGGAENG